MLTRLHARLGDFWWYSLMIFVACRSGDVIQAFIGLWLVPKYVGPEELGAVLPLQQLSGLFTVPLAVLATVFAKYVNVYATRGEFGKVKCLVRDVLVASAALFAICIGAAYLTMPFFYTRLAVISGSLTALVLAAGFAGNVASLFTSALQGLKMFKTITVQNLISAPIRLATLLVAMPIRALSGYLLGQATPPAACSLLAFGSLRRRLAPHPYDTSWRKDLPEIGRYLWPVAAYMAFGTLFATISATVYRQRLPEVESAAHYLLSRFSEIAGYTGTSMIAVLVPLASEAHERGTDNSQLLRQALLGTLVVTAVLALAFASFGNRILNLSSVWRQYADYARLLPWMAVITGSSISITTIVTYEMACRRFGIPTLVIGINLFWTLFLVVVTGFEYFRGLLPDSLVTWVVDLRLARLDILTFATIAVHLLQFAALPFFSHRQKTSAWTKTKL